MEGTNHHSTSGYGADPNHDRGRSPTTRTETELHQRRLRVSFPSQSPRRHLVFSPAGSERDDDSWLERYNNGNNVSTGIRVVRVANIASPNPKRQKVDHCNTGDSESMQNSDSSPGSKATTVVDEISDNDSVSLLSRSTLQGSPMSEMTTIADSPSVGQKIDAFLRDSDRTAIPRKNFSDLVKEISRDFGRDRDREERIAKGAVEAMQAVSESHLVDMLYASEQACKSAKRKRPTYKDAELVNKIWRKFQY